MPDHVALFAVGLVLLAVGTGALVIGAARLDRGTGRSAFAVGLVAVGFGPCVAGLAFDLAMVLRPAPAPASEARVALEARLAGAAVLGNVVGGTVASALLVLGAAALVRPVAPAAKLFGTALPVLFGAVLLFWFLAADKDISRTDAGVLLVGSVGALALLIRAARREPEEVKVEFGSWVPERMPLWFAGLLALAGSGATVGGAWLAAGELFGATRAARTSVPVMGATAVAFGTALPALVAAVAAARRGRSELVLGLAVGPALFNLLLVVGAVALVQPLALTEHAILNEIPAMALCSFLLLPVPLTGKVPRWEGALFLAAYVGFITWQVLRVAPAR